MKEQKMRKPKGIKIVVNGDGIGMYLYLAKSMSAYDAFVAFDKASRSAKMLVNQCANKEIFGRAKRTPVSPEQIEFVRKNMKKMGTKDMAEKLGCSMPRIYYIKKELI